ncbi:hypothetical protein quinque_000068 [Culex quinquefasciatus]
MTVEKCNPTRPKKSTKVEKIVAIDQHFGWTKSGLVCVQRVGDGQADRDAFRKNAALLKEYRNVSRKINRLEISSEEAVYNTRQVNQQPCLSCPAQLLVEHDQGAAFPEGLLLLHLVSPG